jgi:hypothetical protein
MTLRSACGGYVPRNSEPPARIGQVSRVAECAYLSERNETVRLADFAFPLKSGNTLIDRNLRWVRTFFLTPVADEPRLFIPNQSLGGIPSLPSRSAPLADH